MCRPSRWWIGLFPLALLFLAALWLKTPHVQADVAANAKAALDQQGLIEPVLGVEGRDVRLAGLATTEAGIAAAADAARAATGVRLVDSALKALPVQKPYALAMTRAADAITLTGAAPDPATRAAIVAAAKAVAPNVVDKMSWAAGAPAGLADMARAALAGLAPLTAGTASLADAALSLSGQAPDANARDRAMAALRAGPAGMTLAKADIGLPTVSPYVFAAQRDGGGLTLTGHAPDAGVKARLLDAARRIAPQVTDRLEIGAGAPAGFEPMAAAALAAIAPLPKATATLTDSSLRVTGEASDQLSLEAARAALAARPKELTLAAADIAAPLMSPFRFAAARNNGRIVLTGAVPDEATRARLVAAARASGAQVDDRLVVARGAGPNFEAQARAAIAALGPLLRGEATLSDATLDVAGEAASTARKDDAISALAAPGLTLGRVAIAARAPEPAPVPPPPAPEPTIPPGPTLATPPIPPAPPFAGVVRQPNLTPAQIACQGPLLERLARDTIEFATGSTRISDKSEKLVEELAGLVKACSDVALEVSGHTDNVGDPDKNLALSRGRAHAVVQALVKAGAPADKLTAEGYGEGRPIAPNDTPEGRARNRRIEFAVK